MKLQSLAQRIFLVTFLALLPAIAIVISNVLSLYESRTREVEAQALKNAELVHLEMERIVSGAENVLIVVANSLVVRRHDVADCASFAERVVTALPYLAGLTITDPDGTVWCLPSSISRSVYVGDRPYFQEAMTTSDRVIGVFTEDRATGRNVLPIALRYQGPDGTTAGVVAVYLDLGWLQTTIEEHSIAEGNSLTLADRDGRILARTPLPEKFVGTVIPDSFQRLVRAPSPGSEHVLSQDGTQRIIGYFPATYGRDRIYVSTGIALDTAFAMISRAAFDGLYIWIIGAVAAGLLAATISRNSIVKPFGRLVATIDSWRAGNVDARSGMTAAQGEIGQVGLALDAFMNELAQSRAARVKAEQQRDLMVQELGHRVKNLLTMIQAVARQTFSQVEDKDVVNIFSARIRSLAAANDLLLKGSQHAALLGHVIETSIGPFRDKTSDQFVLSFPKLDLSSSATVALGMALHELCTNAAKYGALATKAGSVLISADVSEDGNFSLIWTERGGPPVVPPSRIGFGTKVIRQVLEQSISGSVEVDYAESGLVCRITAPLASVAATEDLSL